MENISISLTQFIDFTLKNGESKVKKVRDIKEQAGYHPAFDYWRELREAIKQLHENEYRPDFLDGVVEKVHPRKKLHYAESVKQYKKFCRKKSIEWFDPGKSFWTSNDLIVRSSPELGLIIDGKPHLIKLYFKELSEKMDKRSAATTLTLMAASTREIEHDNASNCVLNIKKCALYPVTRSDVNTDRLLSLDGEAAHFVHIWNNV